MTDTIFQKIIDKEIPADLLHEDDDCIALPDISPQAPVHVLIIPKQSLAKLQSATQADQALLGHLLLVANQLATQLNIADDYRLVINNGAKAGQSVFHLHIHLLGGRVMNWPPG
jgi:histidine triad (HIT) family protein